MIATSASNVTKNSSVLLSATSTSTSSLATAKATATASSKVICNEVEDTIKDKNESDIEMEVSTYVEKEVNDVVEVDVSQLTCTDGKYFIRPDKIQDLIKDKKVVLTVQSEQAKKKKKIKIVNENKIRKGKIAKELKQKRKQDTIFILTSEKGHHSALHIFS